MELTATYKLRFECPRWSGIVGFLKSEANFYQIDIKIESQNTFLTTSGSFVATGNESSVMAFKSSVEKSFDEYNKD